MKISFTAIMLMSWIQFNASKNCYSFGQGCVDDRCYKMGGYCANYGSAVTPNCYCVVNPMLENEHNWTYINHPDGVGTDRYQNTSTTQASGGYGNEVDNSDSKELVAVLLVALALIALFICGACICKCVKSCQEEDGVEGTDHDSDIDEDDVFEGNPQI